MAESTKAKIWIAIFVMLIIAPVLILFLPPRPEGREFWREVSVALGFAGLALMGMQFIPTARLPFLASTFPMDTLYEFHHRISIAGFTLALLHPLILFIGNPLTLALLNVFEATWQARAGVIGIVLFLVVIATSVWRLDFNLRYEIWRLVHHFSAILAAGLILYHIFLVNHYTANPIMRGYWIVMAVIWAGTAIYVRLIKPLMLLRRPYRIMDVIPRRDETWSLVLEPVDHPGIDFNAGQFAWLIVRRSPFSIRQHPFSFASSADLEHVVEFTIKELGDFTSNVVPDLKVGETVYVDGPYGNFGLERYAAPGYGLVAGGSGTVPVISILRTLSDRKDQRPIYFFYGNPDWESVAYMEDLEELEEILNLKVIHLLENPHEGWEGETGFITTEILDRHLPENRKELQYFICGPLPMIQAAEKGLLELGVPLKQIQDEGYEMA